MRIGLITGEYPPMQGGVGDYTHLLATAMAAQGHDVFVLTNPQGKNHEDGIHVSAEITNWNRAFFRQVTAWAKKHALEVINLQYQTAAFNMAGLIHLLPLRCRPTPYVTTFHDLRFPYLFPKAGRIRPYAVKLMAKLSSGVIVTNRADERALQNEVQNLIRIPLGANVGHFPTTPGGRERIRAQMGATDDTLVVGYFGFINASKGVDTLLKGAHLAHQQGVKIQVMMIGGRTGASDPTNFAYAQIIDQLAAQINLEPYWTGFLADDKIADAFAAVDVMALPYRDGASLRRGSLLGAVAHGCAIITTHPTDDDLPEFENALAYIPVGDEKALAQQLIRLAGDPTERARLGVAAKNAAEQFKWDKIATRTLHFYGKCIEEKK